MYSIQITSKARKELLSLPNNIIATIETKIDALAKNPRPQGYIKMKGSTNEYRIRLGVYRIVYIIVDEILIVTVIKISHRKDVYR